VRRDFPAINKNGEALATVVSTPDTIVEDCQQMSVVRQAVDSEITPRPGGQQGMNDKKVVGTRTQADESSNQGIRKSGVIIVGAASIASSTQGIVLPLARRRRCEAT
jgi:hypothetical protein